MITFQKSISDKKEKERPLHSENFMVRQNVLDLDFLFFSSKNAAFYFEISFSINAL